MNNDQNNYLPKNYTQSTDKMNQNAIYTTATTITDPNLLAYNYLNTQLYGNPQQIYVQQPLDQINQFNTLIPTSATLQGIQPETIGTLTSTLNNSNLNYSNSNCNYINPSISNLSNTNLNNLINTETIIKPPTHQPDSPATAENHTDEKSFDGSRSGIQDNQNLQATNLNPGSQTIFNTQIIQGIQTNQSLQGSSSSSKVQTQNRGMELRPKIGQSSTHQRGTEIFIGNLSIDTEEDDLRKLFTEFGDILDIRIHKTQTKKCYAFVRFLTKEQAKLAISKNGVILNFRQIKVTKSNDNSTIFIGNIRKNWTNNEIESKVRRIVSYIFNFFSFPIVKELSILPILILRVETGVSVL